MALAYAFDKAKLPRGLSFPLKRSVLDTALLEAGISGIHGVYYWQRQSGTVVMRADYRGEGRRGWAAAGRASITVYAVPTEERQKTEAILVSEVLPRLVRWLRELEVSGNVRRGVDQHLLVAIETGEAKVSLS